MFRTVFLLTLMGGLGFGNARAQEEPTRSLVVDGVTVGARPLVRSDARLYPPSLAEPFQIREPSGLPFQEEVAEPGSFIMGAVTGGVLAYVLFADSGDGGVDRVFWVPISALVGGVLFWTIGIG